MISRIPHNFFDALNKINQFFIGLESDIYFGEFVYITFILAAAACGRGGVGAALEAPFLDANSTNFTNSAELFFEQTFHTLGFTFLGNASPEA